MELLQKTGSAKIRLRYYNRKQVLQRLDCGITGENRLRTNKQTKKQKNKQNVNIVCD